MRGRKGGRRGERQGVRDGDMVHGKGRRERGKNLVRVRREDVKEI